MRALVLKRGMRRAFSLLSAGAVAMLAMTVADAQKTPVRVFAAGSLMTPLTRIADALRTQGIEIAFTFGPSGTLRARLERGERADLFASANMAHPQALHDAGKSEAVALF